MRREWKNAPLGELCTVCAGGTPSRAKPEYWDGDTPWVKISDMLQGTITATDERITRLGLENSAAKLLPPGTLLLSIFATIGRTAVLGIEAATNQAIVGLSVRDHNQLDLDFLRRFLELKTVELEGRARGVAQANINGAILKAVRIPLPPLAEQRRIAEVLDRAEALRAKRRAALAQLDSLTQSLFLDLFGNPAENPKKWRMCAVGEIADCIVPGRDKPKSFTGDVPWITTDDLRHLEVTSSSPKKLGLSAAEIAEVRARVIPEGSVIISCVGDLGIVSLAGADLVINQQLHSFQCHENVDNLFLMHCLAFQEAFMYAKASSTTLPYMNKTVCNSIPVVVPPIPLQREFARRVTAVEALKTTHRASLAELDALFAALQHRAFRGEL